MLASVFSMAWNKVVMRAFLMVYCGKIPLISCILTMKNNSFTREFWTSHRRSRSFHDVKLPVLQLCLGRQHIMTNVFLFQKLLFQFNSWIVRSHFARVMSLNNWKMIAKTWSYIFRRSLAVVDVMFALPSTSAWWDIPQYTTSKVLHN